MGNFFGVLSGLDILFALAAAYLITRLILRIKKVRGVLKNKEQLSMDYKLMDLGAVMAKCKELFPIDTIYFRGQVFRRGMQVKIITMQKKVIEGELIGKNKIDLVCVRTQNHIIAHEIDKIEDMAVAED